jgi:DNA-binding Lrp family transcriptional regulator
MTVATAPEPDAGPTELDELDLDMVAALQIAPRASFNLLAEVLGSSPSTVARRLGRLESAGLIRVIGQVDWSLRSSTQPHHVWISATPGAVPRVAEELTRLPEAQFVAIAAGRADIYMTVLSPTRQDATELLIRTVPGIEGVVSTSSELVLRAATRADQWRLDRLTVAQVGALEEAEGLGPGEDGGPQRLSEQERTVAELLYVDGRMPASEVGRVLGISRSRAHRIVTTLLSRRVVRPRVEIEPALLGYPLEATLHLDVRAADIAPVSRWCARHPSARYVSVVAGESSVVHQGVFAGEQELARFLETDLAELSGVLRVRSSVFLVVLQRYFLRRDHGRIADGPPGPAGLPA